MHPQIAEPFRNIIYQNKALKTPENLSNNREFPYAENDRRIEWIDVKGSCKKGKSLNNQKEADIIAEKLISFSEWAADNPNQNKDFNGNKQVIWNVAVLTFYSDQVVCIKKALDSKKIVSNHEKNIQISVNTVDSFQGQEADIVYLSFVKTKSRNVPNIGFLNNSNRINVAGTRAKCMLYLIGDKENFKDCDSKILKELASNDGVIDFKRMKSNWFLP